MGFWKDEGGVINVLLVVLLPVLIGIAGIAIDLSALNDQRRYVQHAADAGALAGIRQLGSAAEMRQAVRDTVAQNTRFKTDNIPDTDIVLGNMVSGQFHPLINQNDGIAADALEVTVRSPSKLMLLSLFVKDDRQELARSARAAAQPRVSFGLSNCLLQTRLFRNVLQPILGTDLDVLCAGRLAATRLDVAQFLGGVALDANLSSASGSDATYGDILDALVDPSRLMARAVGRSLPLSGRLVRLGDVIYMPDDLKRIRLSRPFPPISVGAQDIVMASAHLLMAQIVDTSVNVQLGGIQANLSAKVGDPGQIVIGARPGDPLAVAKSAQIDVVVGPINILDVIALHLDLKVANASAHLTAEGGTCAREPSSVIAIFDPARASVLDLSLRVKALGLPVSYDAAATKTRLVNTAFTQRIAFTRAEYEAQTVKTFGPVNTTGVTQILNQLMSTSSGTTDDARRAIEAQKNAERCTNLLGCLLNTTLNLVNGILNTLSTTVQQLAGSSGSTGTLTRSILNDLIALRVANADLKLLDVLCGASGRLVH